MSERLHYEMRFLAKYFQKRPKDPTLRGMCSAGSAEKNTKFGIVLNENNVLMELLIINGSYIITCT